MLYSNSLFVFCYSFFFRCRLLFPLSDRAAIAAIDSNWCRVHEKYKFEIIHRANLAYYNFCNSHLGVQHLLHSIEHNARNSATKDSISKIHIHIRTAANTNFEILAPVFSPSRHRNSGFVCISIWHRQPVFQHSNHSVTIFHFALRCFGWCHLHCT